MVKNKYLDGLEKALERKVPEKDRRWQVAKEPLTYNARSELHHNGWPIDTDDES